MICEHCGASVTKLILRGASLWCAACCAEARVETPGVIADDIPGGFVQEHFGDRPETFYSWSAMRQRADQLGLQPFVRRLEQIREGDYIDAQTLENARILLSRGSSAPDPDPARLETVKTTVRTL